MAAANRSRRLKEREQWQQYGFHNFGDYYGEMGWAWGNNEYDPAYAHLLEFLRGGQRGWAELAGQEAWRLLLAPRRPPPA